MIVFMPVNYRAFEDIVLGGLQSAPRDAELVVISIGSSGATGVSTGIKMMSTKHEYVRGKPFQEHPIRNRVRAVLIGIELLRILRRLRDPRWLVLETTAYFPLRLAASWARRRGIRVAVLGVMTGDYSDNRWSKTLSLPRMVVDELRTSRLGWVRLPMLGVLFLVGRVLDRLTALLLRLVFRRETPELGWGGLAPYAMPLGPVKPNAFIGSAFGVTDQFRRVFGAESRVFSVQDGQYFRCDTGQELEIRRGNRPSALVLIPRSSSVFVGPGELDRILTAVLTELPTGGEVSLRTHPQEDPHFEALCRERFRRAGFDCVASNGPLWSELVRFDRIYAFGRSSAAEFAARNFGEKTAWCDSPHLWDEFVVEYQARPTLADCVNALAVESEPDMDP